MHEKNIVFSAPCQTNRVRREIYLRKHDCSQTLASISLLKSFHSTILTGFDKSLIFTGSRDLRFHHETFTAARDNPMISKAFITRLDETALDITEMAHSFTKLREISWDFHISKTSKILRDWKSSRNFHKISWEFQEFTRDFHEISRIRNLLHFA